MNPAKYDLSLYRGDSVRMQFRLWADPDRTQPIDLDGVMAASQIRTRPDGDILAEFVCTVTLPNVVDVSLDSDASRFNAKKGAWDLRLAWPGGDVLTPVAGAVKVKPDITLEAP
jgi:hypothetical protein